jgi:hypothetical protein
VIQTIADRDRDELAVASWQSCHPSQRARICAMTMRVDDLRSTTYDTAPPRV